MSSLPATRSESSNGISLRCAGCSKGSCRPCRNVEPFVRDRQNRAITFQMSVVYAVLLLAVGTLRAPRSRYRFLWCSLRFRNSDEEVRLHFDSMCEWRHSRDGFAPKDIQRVLAEAAKLAPKHRHELAWCARRQSRKETRIEQRLR
jgi:hypothetical protein